MSDITLEKVIADIQTMGPESLRQLRRIVDERLRSVEQSSVTVPDSRIIGEAPPPKDRRLEDAWLESHRDEYAGEWVALAGNRLIAHSSRLKEVAEIVWSEGIEDALFIRVEPGNAAPF